MTIFQHIGNEIVLDALEPLLLLTYLGAIDFTVLSTTIGAWLPALRTVRI